MNCIYGRYFLKGLEVLHEIMTDPLLSSADVETSRGIVERVEVDTAHFKGNYPDRVSVEAALFASHDEASADSERWQTLLPEAKLSMDQQHYFDTDLEEVGPVSHVRMSIYPDGGVSRLRVFGRLAGKD